MDSKQKNRRTTYKRITEQIRLELIERVIQKGENIKQVVNDMNINISTAKAILKVYQEQGRVGKKKKRDKVINVIQTYSFYTIDGSNIEKMAETVIEEEKKSIQTNDNRNIELQLKDKSRERAEQLIKQAINKYNQNNENAEIQRNLSELTALQNQLFYQYCNQQVPFSYGINFPYNK